jgi:RIO kinase 2
MGSRNHEIVPISLIASIAHMPCASINRLLSELAQHSLVGRVKNAKCNSISIYSPLKMMDID